MNRPNTWIWPFCTVLISFAFLLLPALTWGQDDNWDQSSDPPARVARLDTAQGSVSFQPGGEGDWVEAVPNRPLTSGDNLWTDRDSRAELHAGSTAIRLGAETSVTFLDLDDHTLQVRVAQGTVMVRLLHMDEDDLVEIDTPNVAFQVTRPGEFRVDVVPDGETTFVDVINGRGEVVGGGNTYTVVAGQQAVFTGDQTLSYDLNSLPDPDDFDRWCFGLDHREDQSASANYVSREMTGYEDLDDYGAWSYAGDYGPVWIPSNMPVGWAPYRFGHWIWVAPWGWTWVDDQPWGFAPFHYGRWCMVRGVWAWVPGPVAVRPVYAPALVVFVGGGFFGGGPGVAWFPLGPGEVFIPAYHVSPRYVNQVNITNTVVNVTTVTNVYNSYRTNNTTAINNIAYRNRAVSNAITAVSRDTFVNARPVSRNIVTVQPREIAQGHVTPMPAIEPARTSVIGAGKPTTAAPPAKIINRRVVAVRTPSPPPTPFAQRQDKLLVRPVPPPTQQRNSGQQGQGNPQGNQPAPRTEVQLPRPSQPPTQSEPRTEPTRPETAQPSQPPRPEQPVRPPEPERAQPPQPARPPQPSGEIQQQQETWHPQVRPAPPVQPKTEQQVQQDESKYRNWQQKQEQKQQKSSPPPRSEGNKSDNSKKH